MHTALYCLTPPPCEPVSLELVRQHLRIDYLDDDDLLTFYLQAARELVEQYLGRCLITQELEWVFGQDLPQFSYPMVPFGAFIMPLWRPWPFLSHNTIDLPRARVQKVVSIKTGTNTGHERQLPENEWQVDTALEPARLRLLNDMGASPYRHISVRFMAGYGSCPDNVPTPVRNAVLLVTARLYENRGDTGEAELPNVVKNLLNPYRLVFFA